MFLNFLASIMTPYLNSFLLLKVLKVMFALLISYCQNLIIDVGATDSTLSLQLSYF